MIQNNCENYDLPKPATKCVRSWKTRWEMLGLEKSLEHRWMCMAYLCHYGLF